MPRGARAIADNQVDHVLNRGNGRAEVFHQVADFAAFVKRIGAGTGSAGDCPTHHAFLFWV